ncbi:hypothetical protein [Paracandidimonas soli]|uniref:hypothetical protein n=1 Tax=Paracandidimonas soli TaxID=1917182 RepID=UPI001044ECD8|nr:hypothetical protein [Paracandidimonas soli]
MSQPIFGQKPARPAVQNFRRIPEIQRRLDLWAEWRLNQGGGGGGGGSVLGYLVDVAAGRRVDGDADSPRSIVPVDSIECSITDDAVMALPDELRKAVKAWHCASSGTLDEIARELGVVRGTLHRRLCHADIRIREWLRARRKAVS